MRSDLAPQASEMLVVSLFAHLLRPASSAAPALQPSYKREGAAAHMHASLLHICIIAAARHWWGSENSRRLWLFPGSFRGSDPRKVPGTCREKFRKSFPESQNVGPAPLQQCVGDFCCEIFGGFCLGFSWRIFLPQKLEKIWRENPRKNPAAQK